MLRTPSRISHDAALGVYHAGLLPRAILGLLATAALPAAIPGQVSAAAGPAWLPLPDPSVESSQAAFSVGLGVRSIEAKVECSATDADGRPMRIEARMKLRGDDLTEAGAKVVAPGGP